METELKDQPIQTQIQAIADALKPFGMVVWRVAVEHSPTDGVAPHFKISGIIPTEEDINAWH